MLFFWKLNFLLWSHIEAHQRHLNVLRRLSTASYHKISNLGFINFEENNRCLWIVFEKRKYLKVRRRNWQWIKPLSYVFWSLDILFCYLQFSSITSTCGLLHGTGLVLGWGWGNLHQTLQLLYICVHWWIILWLAFRKKPFPYHSALMWYEIWI